MLALIRVDIPERKPRPLECGASFTACVRNDSLVAGAWATSPLMYCSNDVSGGCTCSICSVVTRESGAMRWAMWPNTPNRSVSVPTSDRSEEIRPVSRRIVRARTVRVSPFNSNVPTTTCAAPTICPSRITVAWLSVAHVRDPQPLERAQPVVAGNRRATERHQIVGQHRPPRLRSASTPADRG